MTALLSMYESLASWLYSEKDWLHSEKGQTTIEYILVIVLIALVILVAFQTSVVGNAIETAVDRIAAALETDPNAD